MSEENFFTRWSRRKREAALDTRGSAPSDGAAREWPPKLPTVPAPPITREGLPSIDAIDAATDIRGFLAEGVPTAVSRAALRRAWASDPAIRDFVGLAENAWDFTSPDGVTGFGTISAEDVRRLLTPAKDVPAMSPESEAAAPSTAGASPSQAPAGPRADEPERRASSSLEATGGDDARPATSSPSHRHGGALPRSG